MTQSIVMWAGRALDGEEAERVREMAALLTRLGEPETAAHLVRFLPESEHEWTPDEYEMGAHAGPWLEVDARSHRVPPQSGGAPTA